MSPRHADRWELLVIGLPGRHGTTRMRVWRALKAAGAAVLRDGVYLLPDRPPAHEVFVEQAREVTRAGGSAHVFRLEDIDPAQAAQFRQLFDRGGDYARLLERARALRQRLTRRGGRAAEAALRQLRRDHEAIRAADYFSGPAAAQALEFVEETAALIAAAVSPGEPARRSGSIPRRPARDYRGRQWATRARPWVDRLASAWLIKRHIDPRARFLWLKRPEDCPKRALGFDFDGATFTHVGARVTFETLMTSFGLEGDAALMKLAAVVHYLDVGGAPAVDAAGVESILRGMRGRITDDDALLAEAVKIFDHLYLNYAKT